MDQLAEAIRSSLSAPGVADKLPQQPALLDTLARTLERSIRQHCGGTTYLAKRGTREQVNRRNERMREQFTGNNLAELASQYDITLRHARRALTRPKK